MFRQNLILFNINESILYEHINESNYINIVNPHLLMFFRILSGNSGIGLRSSSKCFIANIG